MILKLKKSPFAQKLISLFNCRWFYLVIVLWFAFHRLFEKLIDKYVVKTVLPYFEDNIWNRIIFIIICVIIVFHFFKDLFSNKYVKNSTVLLSLLVLFFWFYYRFIDCIWTYVAFDHWDICYIDLVVVMGAKYLLIRLFHKNKKGKDEQQGFLLDVPITRASQDLLGRNELAKEIADKIKKVKTNDGSFSLGIESAWGNGKTSFINLLYENIKSSDTVIFRFNPWTYDKNTNLIDAFFIQLSENLKVYNFDLAATLLDYASILSSSNIGYVSPIFKTLTFCGGKSIELKYDEISQDIKNIDKQIVVIIDDLDRLDSNEILTILKLIRNIANFPNIIFISAYDREYLTELLSKNNIYKCDIYLDKIFQLEIHLPVYDKKIIKNVFFKEGKTFLQENDIKEYSEVFDDHIFNEVHTGFICDMITNLRDIYRFINNFHLSYDSLKGDIVIKDLMNIELLKIKYPYVYDLLANNYELYLTKGQAETNLIMWDESMKEEKSLFSVNHKNLMSIIEKKYGDGDTDDVDNIKIIMKALFNNSFISPKKKAINNVYYIDRYFYNCLLDFDISENEFNEVMKLSFEDIKQRIDQWSINQSHSLSLLLATYKCNDIDEYKKLMRCIFYLGKVSNKWANDANEIEPLINNSPIKDKEEHIDFLLNTFFENGLSEFVPRYIHSRTDNSVDWHYIISKEKCIEICYDMFKLACNENEDMQTIYRFFSYTTFFEFVRKSENSSQGEMKEKNNPKAIQCFINFVSAHPEKALTTFVMVDKKEKKNIPDWVYNYWEGKDEFEKFLAPLSDSNQLFGEFYKFFTKLKSNKFEPIPFDFKYLQ